MAPQSARTIAVALLAVLLVLLILATLAKGRPSRDSL